MYQKFLPALTLAVLTATPALAHDGRRFEIQIFDGQLVAQGYITDGIDDGGGVVRPYLNTIHGHFENKTSNFATADLPGYDILGNADALIGYSLIWEPIAFSKWTTPDTTGPVSLTPLDAGETIEVVFGGSGVSSDGPFGPIEFFASVPGSNAGDIDLSYDFFGDNPAGQLYVIQSVLKTDAPGIADSATIYTILSPDGVTMQERLHMPSLFAEQSLGAPVPEPGAMGLAALLPVLMRRRRRSA